MTLNNFGRLTESEEKCISLSVEAKEKDGESPEDGGTSRIGVMVDV